MEWRSVCGTEADCSPCVWAEEPSTRKFGRRVRGAGFYVSVRAYLLWTRRITSVLISIVVEQMLPELLVHFLVKAALQNSVADAFRQGFGLGVSNKRLNPSNEGWDFSWAKRAYFGAVTFAKFHVRLIAEVCEECICDEYVHVWYESCDMVQIKRVAWLGQARGGASAKHCTGRV